MNNKKLPIKKYHLRVKTDLECLSEVLYWFEKIIIPILPERIRWESEIALTEGFTNAVRHAHLNLPQDTPIDINIEFFDNFLEIRIWDFGKPFDLFQKLESIKQNQAEQLEKEGGRGLQFMEKLTDELEYLRLTKVRNCLIMRKFL
jgi:serine/threonine-protein kinase RsbW